MGQFPAAFAAPQSFGPRVQALATYFHEVHHLPYARLQTVMEDVLGLPLAEGSLVNLVQRTGLALEPQAEAIRLEVVNSPVIGSDETRARIDGDNRWEWVFRTPQASYYVVVPSRGSQVIRDVLGDAKPETWVSDLWSAQQKAPAQHFQLCLAHQHRDLEYAEERGDSVFAPAMQTLLFDAQDLGKERAGLPGEEFLARKAEIEARCDALLHEDVENAWGWGLQERYRKHREKLFVFLEREGVPPDNNGSERDLRNSVVHRKVTGGFRSEQGAKTYSTVISVVETAKKRGQNVLEVLVHAIGRVLPHWQPAGNSAPG